VELSTLDLPKKQQKATQVFVTELSRLLRDNLFSIVVYGSAVRGGFNAQTSDINLLIVLEFSTPEAHGVIADVIAQCDIGIEPFILARTGMERSFRAFAPKFDSLKRHYAVVHGADPLASYKTDPTLAAFLVEQALRNLRLRAVQAYVHYRHDAGQYHLYLGRTVPVIFTDLSEVLRLQDIEVPNQFADRVPILASEYGVTESGLSNLLAIADQPNAISSKEIVDIHRFLFTLLDTAVTRVSAL
jgi:hypothetical protein